MAVMRGQQRVSVNTVPDNMTMFAAVLAMEHDDPLVIFETQRRAQPVRRYPPLLRCLN
nr:hypothetical protein [Asticcacaulis benevestitus]